MFNNYKFLYFSIIRNYSFSTAQVEYTTVRQTDLKPNRTQQVVLKIPSLSLCNNLN